MADIGWSFSPTSAQNVSGPYAGTNRGGGLGNVNPVQDAIRILSFRLPSVLGALAPTSAQNLGQSALGNMNSALTQNYLNYALSGLNPTSFSGGNPNPQPPYGFQNFLAANNGGMPQSQGSQDLMPAPPSVPNSGLPVSFTYPQPRPSAPTFGASAPLGGAMGGAMGGGGFNGGGKGY